MEGVTSISQSAGEPVIETRWMNEWMNVKAVFISDSYFDGKVIFLWFVVFEMLMFLGFLGLQRQNKDMATRVLRFSSWMYVQSIFLKGQRRVAVQNVHIQIGSVPDRTISRAEINLFPTRGHLICKTNFSFKRTEPCAVGPLANWCAATCVDQIRLLMIDRLHAHWHQDFIWVYFLHCFLFYYFILCWFSSGAPFSKISSLAVVNNAFRRPPRTKGKEPFPIFSHARLDCRGMSKEFWGWSSKVNKTVWCKMAAESLFLWPSELQPLTPRFYCVSIKAPHCYFIQSLDHSEKKNSPATLCSLRVHNHVNIALSGKRKYRASLQFTIVSDYFHYWSANSFSNVLLFMNTCIKAFCSVTSA